LWLSCRRSGRRMEARDFLVMDLLRRLVA